MALILAINTEGRQTAALERLARELHGHELMGADSCAVAIAAVERRVPDLVLLPPTPEAGQAELLSQLLAVPGGVRTLTLPQPSSDGQAQTESSRSFAEQVRKCLASGPGRPQLVAAGFAVVSWIRARRATWTDTPVPDVAVPELTHVAVAEKTVSRIPASPRPEAVVEADRVEEWIHAEEPAGPSMGSRAADAARAWREPIVRSLPRVAALAGLVALAAAGFIYWPKLHAALTYGVVVLETGPAGSQVFIDGRLAGTTPISAELPAGPHKLEFRLGALSRTTEIVVVARGRQVQRVDWMTKPTGTLQVSSEPSGARVLVDDKFRGTTPLSVDSLSVGPHSVTIESPRGSVRRTVAVTDGQTAQVNESIVPGSLAVFAPFEIQISERNAQIRLDDRNRTVLSPGLHQLRFQNSALEYDEVRPVEIRPGETTTLNLVPRTTISVTATEPAEVWIDGARAGATPLAGFRINIGTRTVVLKRSSGDDRQFSITATGKPVQLDVDFSMP